MFKRAIVVKLPQEFIEDVDSLTLQGDFDFVNSYGHPVDVHGLSIGDYAHRYLVGMFELLTGMCYWRTFETISPRDTVEKLYGVMSDYRHYLHPIREAMLDLSPLFSLHFLDLNTVIIKDENDYVAWPKTHWRECYRDHPDLHTATLFTEFFQRPINFHLYGPS